MFLLFGDWSTSVTRMLHRQKKAQSDFIDGSFSLAGGFVHIMITQASALLWNEVAFLCE